MSKCGAEQAVTARDIQRRVKRGDRVGVFRARIYVAFRGTDGEAGDHHALDQYERIAFHQHPIGERAGVAFIRIADDELAFALRVSGGLPLDAGREACATATAQA